MAKLFAHNKKPFEVLAEGLVSKVSGGGGTPMELFVVGLADWPKAMSKLFDHSDSSQR
jgi:hypothetical protein